MSYRAGPKIKLVAALIGLALLVFAILIVRFPFPDQDVLSGKPINQAQLPGTLPGVPGDSATATPTSTATAVPTTTPTATATSTPTPRSQWTIPGMPAVAQSRSLSCEYAAAYAVTKFWGRPVTEADFIREIPTDPNPHVGFRGNIDGVWGGTEDYGIYAEPIAAILGRKGYRSEVFYGSVERLRAEISQGRPVVVWYTGIAGDFQRTRLTSAGREFSVVPYEHAVVVYGFDQRYVQLMDVGRGIFTTMEWSEFLRRWSLLDQMALVMIIVETPITPTPSPIEAKKP